MWTPERFSLHVAQDVRARALGRGERSCRAPRPAGVTGHRDKIDLTERPNRLHSPQPMPLTSSDRQLRTV